MDSKWLKIALVVIVIVSVVYVWYAVTISSNIDVAKTLVNIIQSKYPSPINDFIKLLVNEILEMLKHVMGVV